MDNPIISYMTKVMSLICSVLELIIKPAIHVVDKYKWLSMVTHLHNKTNDEVESSHGDEQHFETHVSEVVHFKVFTN